MRSNRPDSTADNSAAAHSARRVNVPITVRRAAGVSDGNAANNSSAVPGSRLVPMAAINPDTNDGDVCGVTIPMIARTDSRRSSSDINLRANAVRSASVNAPVNCPFKAFAVASTKPANTAFWP